MIYANRALWQAMFACVLILMGASSCVELHVAVPNGIIDSPQVPPSDSVPGFNQTTVTELEVRTAADIPLFPADVDRILQDGNTVANFSDGFGDTECSLHLTVKDGGVGKFDSPQIIRDQDDMDELNAHFKGLKVVKEIRWCGQPWPNFLGCQRGDGIVVVRPHASQEGILWLHELGHLYGLEHRNQQFAVMNEVISLMNKNLNPNECASYR